MNETAIILALLAPLVAALLMLATPKHDLLAKIAGLLGLSVALAASIQLMRATWHGDVIAIQVGNWQAPFGIVLVADGLSSLMLVASQTIALASLIFCYLRLDQSYERRFLYPLFMTLLMGANGAFLTGDLFNLYVWFEVLLLSSFAIMAMMRGTQPRRVAWNYVVMNLVSSFLFLMSVGIIYGKTGILNFAALRTVFEQSDESFLIVSSATLLFGAFAIKSALIPLAFWLPGSYPKLPAPIAALFGAILTKVGLYAFYRVFGMVFANGESFIHQDILLVAANLTMLIGVFGAMAQNEMKAILSFHIISQVGYMAVALALYSPASLAAGILYLMHHIIAKGNLFLAADMASQHSGNSRLDQNTGIYSTAPLAAIAFAISALALAGAPPLSGFFAKFSLLSAGAELEAYFSLAIMVLVGVFTLFSMVKIWRGKFWGAAEQSSQQPRQRIPKTLLATSLSLAALTITLGIFAQPLIEFAETSANGLKHPERYIEAVLGTAP